MRKNETGEDLSARGGLGLFERYLTVWVALCIVLGVAIGQLFPCRPRNAEPFLLTVKCRSRSLSLFGS